MRALCGVLSVAHFLHGDRSTRAQILLLLIIQLGKACCFRTSVCHLSHWPGLSDCYMDAPGLHAQAARKTAEELRQAGRSAAQYAKVRPPHRHARPRMPSR